MSLGLPWRWHSTAAAFNGYRHETGSRRLLRCNGNWLQRQLGARQLAVTTTGSGERARTPICRTKTCRPTIERPRTGTAPRLADDTHSALGVWSRGVCPIASHELWVHLSRSAASACARRSTRRCSAVHGTRASAARADFQLLLQPQLDLVYRPSAARCWRSVRVCTTIASGSAAAIEW